MRIFVLFLVIQGLLSSCATGPAYKREYTPLDGADYRFEDKNIVLTYIPRSIESSIPIFVTSKVDKPINIVWDESAFINSAGISEKIFHDQMKIAERAGSIPPSVIPPKASFKGEIIPVSRVSLGKHGWNSQPLCGLDNGFSRDDQDCVGKTFGFFITYQIEGKKNNIALKYKLIQRQPIK